MKSVDDMSNKKRIEYLLQRYSEGRASREELEELRIGLNDPLVELWANDWLFTLIESSPAYTDADKQRLEFILKEIHKQSPQESSAKKILPIWRRWSTIAAAMIIVFVGSYLIFSTKSKDRQNQSQLVNKAILPGHSGAILHLANGKMIRLDTAKNGNLASLENVTVIKKNGTIQYIGTSNKMIYNTITTNRGQQWQLTLSDGTKVWLNAESSISYPLSFNGKDRVVTITGEAYFEVVHNKQQPFKVKVNNQIVEDIGTSFNINAYKENRRVATTLLSGALRVRVGNQAVVLKPGWQAQSDNFIHLKFDVNTDAVIAWKRNLFQFDNADLETIMNQIGRWYNVSIAYKGNLSPRFFSGKIPRDMPLAEVLKILQQLGVHFEIQHEKPNSVMAGKIIVLP
ncbi:FecR family protein [Arachidicoccus soli]|uniref:FecR family protein n=1 Tax=Arachidicoccus soli TaxID=2341117 RepID=A0A386HQ62_9BACT|nr:FecR family protein [Arachidicoccus soli]AYD48087.1 FecR family protein [Arachidicoccus soli]